jgi:protein SCO1/2
MKHSTHHFSVRLAGLLLLPLLQLAALPAAKAHEGHDKHEAMDLAAPAKRSLVEVSLNNGMLVRQDGAKLSTAKVLDSGKPVVLAFIYTSCTAVCPITSHILSNLQGLLGKKQDQVQIVSVSIDPEFDTPARLLAYSKTLGALPSWQHYTGSLANVVALQKSFGVYRGDKMNHDSFVFVSGAKHKSWVKFEGFPPAAQLMHELNELQEPQGLHEHSKG